MLANNNLKVCWTLAKRDFRFHRAKNCILALAVALVTGLYAFMFLLGGAVEDAYLLNYQYTYGSTSHILYTGLTQCQKRGAAEYRGHPVRPHAGAAVGETGGHGPGLCPNGAVHPHHRPTAGAAG